MLNKNITTAIIAALSLLSLSSASCQHKDKPVVVTEVKPIGPSFDADSALAYCYGQCAFGPRVMNSEAHEQCLDWIVGKFEQYGCEVQLQKAALTGYDGTMLRATNIIASHHPERERHILICAHWDSRPWADNDPDPANWTKPVDAANDGASGVGVILEIARQMQKQAPEIGVDCIFLDAEDWGPGNSYQGNDSEKWWGLGTQHWARNPHVEGYRARYAILLDMVGGKGASFCREGYSIRFARPVVEKVWSAARKLGYSSIFKPVDGGYVTDDHYFINAMAKIPSIDIVPYLPGCRESSFGPTWHTVSDNIDNIDKKVLEAVGKTLIEVIYNEKP